MSKASARIANEFSSSSLGDSRLERRLVEIAERFAAAPGSSFPSLMPNGSELEATYRFLSNERVNWRAVLEPHIEATVRRCEDADLVAAHDTSEFHFAGEDGAREGLGVLANAHRGFEGHFALAVKTGEDRQALGVVGLIPVVTAKHHKKVSASEASRRSTLTPQNEKKSERWNQLVLDVEQRLGRGRAIHVMDREADAFIHWSRWIGEGIRFVVRAKTDRALEKGSNQRMSTALDAAPVQFTREVPLSPRRGSAKKRDAGKANRTPRSGRAATLEVRAAKVTIPRPNLSQADMASCSLNLVHVYEPNPPDGELPVDWTLLTSEPIDTREEIATVIDAYRSRWVIEEFFKALKTGCAIEQRQLMSLHALLNALAIAVPVAWRLLAIRSRARRSPHSPATELFSADELRLLKAVSVRIKLSDEPTAEEALLAIAGLGGHLKRNGSPGWQTLGAGYDRFMDHYAGWLAASQM